MIHPEVFVRHKLTSQDLKGHFDKEPAGFSEGINTLTRMLQRRIYDGRLKNLRDWRYYSAIDMAYEVPYSQTTPTITRYVIQNCLTKKMDYEDTLRTLSAWGLNPADLFIEETRANGMKGLVPNYPNFFKILVPLVKAYVTIRVAKLFTDRDQMPLLKYEPLKMTEENRIRCEVITDIVAAMTAQYGYGSTLRNAIFKALLYSCALMFPMEAWHHEQQENREGETVTVKEGLRYFIPHPTRTIYDLMFGLPTFNTDTGCSWAGYWTVVRYGDIANNPLYWNKDKITFGTNWMQEVTGADQYFAEVYPCQLQFPAVPAMNSGDRETTAAYYTGTEADAAVFLTYMFMRIVPKEYGLGDYSHPVWFRFCVASDCTVLYAEPLAYTPVVYFGADADDLRDRNPSLGLELVPWQDHVGNILSQIILTAKQNLANVMFYDKNLIDETGIRKLENMGENMFRGINYVGYDSYKMQRVQMPNPKDAFVPTQMTKGNTGELTQTLWTALSVLERLLQFSAQEVGSAASHQQSAQEIRTINDNVGTRVAYTGAFIDDAIDAWRRQLFEASVAYSDASFVSQVSTDIPDLDKHLKELGFTVKSKGTRKATITGNKDALMIEEFAAAKDGAHRGTDEGTATVMLQTLQAVSNNPMLAQQIGAKALLDNLTRVAKLGGAPRDFDLTSENNPIQSPEGEGAAPAAPPVNPDEIMQAVTDHIAKPMMEQVEGVKQEVAQVISQQAEQINQVGQALSQQQTQLDDIQKMMSVIMEQAAAAPPAPIPGELDAGIPVGMDPRAGGVVPPVAPPPGAALPFGAPLPPPPGVMPV